MSTTQEVEEGLTVARDLLATAALVRRKVTEGLAGTRLSPEEWLVLEALWAQDGRTQRELADATWREPATVTRLVDGLVGQRLVRRKDDAADKRRTRAWLTERGRELGATLRPRLGESLVGLLTGHSGRTVQDMLAEVRLRIRGP